MLTALTIAGCSSGAGPEDGRDSGVPSATQITTEGEGRDSGDEHEAGGEESEATGEHDSGGEAGQEDGEAAMSSPIIPLGQSWSGVLGGLAISMQYDEETRTVYGTVNNTLSQRLCYVQAEPHIKSGSRTVGELGPEMLGHLDPGQQVTSSLAIASEPELAGVSYDGYVVHMEVFDCSGPGPSPHSGAGAEGRGESGSESVGEDEKEGSGASALARDETLDMIRSGARLLLGYDAASNSFEGTVENMTGGVLGRVRVEVHLSNGTELGPTTPTDVAPGEVLTISLPATEESFTTWTAHVEVSGGGEPGGEHDSGEHGSGSESGGEHRTSGEHRDRD